MKSGNIPPGSVMGASGATGMHGACEPPCKECRDVETDPLLCGSSRQLLEDGPTTAQGPV